MARTRFEEEGTIAVGAKAQMAGEGVNNIEEVPAATFCNKNPHTIKYIDPNLTENQAIKRI